MNLRTEEEEWRHAVIEDFKMYYYKMTRMEIAIVCLGIAQLCTLIWIGFELWN